MERMRRIFALNNAHGQGYAEFALLMGFIGMGLLLTFIILQPSIADVSSYGIQREHISPPTLANYDTSPFERPFPTPTPAPITQ